MQDETEIAKIMQRLLQSVVQFQDMASQLATLSRTMVHNFALLEKLLNSGEDEEKC